MQTKFCDPARFKKAGTLASVFEAVIDATEEAIINAMVAADPVEGANRFFIPALPIDRVRDILAEYKLLAEPTRHEGIVG